MVSDWDCGETFTVKFMQVLVWHLPSEIHSLLDSLALTLLVLWFFWFSIFGFFSVYALSEWRPTWCSFL